MAGSGTGSSTRQAKDPRQVIRAHMASFPPRAGIVMAAIDSLLPQVDRLCLCLNGHGAVPPALAGHDRIEVLIPPADLKDAGKFAFPVADDDVVFTVDDDIIYPPDYVARTLRGFDDVDPGRNVLGYMGNAWVSKPGSGNHGWRNYMFHKAAGQIFKVDVLGTGTACQLGRNLPALADIVTAAGFVDLRHARLHGRAGRRMWVLPRGDDYLRRNLPEDLAGTSLFQTVNRARNPAMMDELARVLAERSAHSGQKLAVVTRHDSGEG